jgi:hypothetical protein
VTGKWLAASITDDIPAVIARMFDEAERRDPGHERTWVALVDGCRASRLVKMSASRRLGMCGMAEGPARCPGRGLRGHVGGVTLTVSS